MNQRLMLGGVRALIAAAVSAATWAGGVCIAASKVVAPDWAEVPNGEAFVKNYPKLAQLLEFEGRATIACAVDIAGTLRGCKVYSEEPSGLGFGQAALAMSASFRLQPRIVNGKVSEGGSVRIPLRFALPNPESRYGVQAVGAAGAAVVGNGGQTSAPASTIDLQRIVVARRVIASAGFADALRARFEEHTSAIEDFDRTGADASALRAAASAFRTAAYGMIDVVAERIAVRMAAEFTPQEIAGLGPVFVPTTMSTMDREEALQLFQRRLQAVQESAVQAALRERYCLAFACEPQPDAVARWSSIPGRRISAFEWAKAPSTIQLRQASSPIVHIFGVAGAALISCRPTQAGTLTGCVTQRESPVGWGFGASAVEVSRHYQLSSSRTHSPILLEVRFPGRSADAETWAMGPPELVEAWGNDRADARQAVALLALLKGMLGELLPTSALSPDQRTALTASIEGSDIRYADLMRRRLAGFLLTQFNPEEIARLGRLQRAIVDAKLEAEAGRLGLLIGEEVRAVASPANKAAREAYCRGRACAAVPTLYPTAPPATGSPPQPPATPPAPVAPPRSATPQR